MKITPVLFLYLFTQAANFGNAFWLGIWSEDAQNNYQTFSLHLHLVIYASLAALAAILAFIRTFMLGKNILYFYILFLYLKLITISYLFNLHLHGFFAT